MRLLVDEMHAFTIAVALRERGHDALAVTEDRALRGLDDEAILEWATSDGRAVLTENVRDFAVIAQRWAQRRRDHAGLVFTSARRFPRNVRSYPVEVVNALLDLAADGWPHAESEVVWL